MINQQIKEYKILSLLGEGGMAKVYLAEHNLLGNKVALKLLNTEFLHNENIKKRFLAEARSMARMSHPNIVKVSDLIDEVNTAAFVMEYVEGETLKEYVDKKGKLSDEEIRSIFSHMLDAVGYVHDQNLVHRDIKPSNFMVTPSGIVKLMDFGIAKKTDANSAEYTQTGTGVQMGTPMYMSPEQITETKSVTPQSDIYSLGVVLWQMVTGDKPYDMNTLSSFHLQNKIVNENLPKTNTIWDTIIEKATFKEIHKRYINCSAFKSSIINNSFNNEEKTVEEKTADNKSYAKSNEQKNNLNKEQIPKKKISWLIPVLVLGVVFILIYIFFLKNNSLFKESKQDQTEIDQTENLPLEITVNASSVLPPSYGYNYEPNNTIDNDLETWWSPSKSIGTDVWIDYSFNQTKTISGISIHAGSHYPNFQNLGNLYWLNLRVSKARVIFSNGYEEIIYLDDIDDLQKIHFSKSVTCEGFRLELLDYFPSDKWNDYCISEVSPLID